MAFVGLANIGLSGTPRLDQPARCNMTRKLTRCELALFPQVVDPALQQCWNDEIIVWEFAVRVSPSKQIPATNLYTPLTISAPSSSFAASLSCGNFLSPIIMSYGRAHEPCSSPSSRRTIAWARATTSVFSARPIRSLPSKERTINLASFP